MDQSEAWEQQTSMVSLVEVAGGGPVSGKSARVVDFAGRCARGIAEYVDGDALPDGDAAEE